MSDKDHNAGLAAGGNDTTVATPQRQAPTPGPWHVDDIFVSAISGKTIAEVYDCYDADDMPNDREQEANAHLIAAAPDSYQANQGALWLLRLIRDAEPEAWRRILALKTVDRQAADVWDALKAAIAKADGRGTP